MASLTTPRLLRPNFLQRLATYGGDKELAQQARAMAEEWFHDHKAIRPQLQSAVFRTAAYYGDRPLFDRFLAELKTSKDRVERQRIINAVASFRDPACIQAGMEAVLSGRIPFLEGTSLFFRRPGIRSHA